jgi:GMP synthase (glutamine-hydrolysing)
MKRPMQCLAIRHLQFEDLGLFEDVLRGGGWAIRYCEAGLDDLNAQDWDAADLVVVLGGPIGVYEQADYPWLAQEITLVQHRLRQDRPTLGICLGAQIMAAALGAAVYPGRGKEIGWSALQLHPGAEGLGLEALAQTQVLHWHGDTFDLPAGATLLASTAMTPHQAFAYGNKALALQFHAEAHGARMEPWLIGHTGELRAAGISIPQLRQAGLENADTKAAAGQALFRRWLGHVGFPT